MSSRPAELLDLPDLVLHNICQYVINPFDLNNLGRTCTRLYRVSSSKSLWWNLATRSLKGIWYRLENPPTFEHPRRWLLSLLNDMKAAHTETMSTVQFQNGEVWVRVESYEFRCLLGLLQLSHVDKTKASHPCVLYEKWLYDMGLFKRVNIASTFTEELKSDVVLELCKLGQAKERDLRARKQPNKSPLTYVKLVRTSDQWTQDLFPAGLSGSTCPLLICPFRVSWNMEMSGVDGLLICVSWVVEQEVISQNRKRVTHLSEIASTVQSVVESFHSFIRNNIDAMKLKWGPYCLWKAVRNLATHESEEFDLSPWQDKIDPLSDIAKLNCHNLILSVEESFEKYDGVDGTVDFIRSQKRKLLMTEIEKILFADEDSGKDVTRINLTDSDYIGGDNNRQEMSAAAFVSQSGVLVTWHLIGRLRS